MTDGPLPGMVAAARQESGVVLDQQRLAHDTYKLRIGCPGIAREIVPGQFFMIRPATGADPLLGRPFALYDVHRAADGAPVGVDFVYHVVGKLTSRMAQWRPGDETLLWGPLGNGFPEFPGKRLLCVGGGIGYTPFLAVARELAQGTPYGRGSRRPPAGGGALTLLYGVRSRAHRADLADFEGIGDLQVRIATDDGSEGHHGFVTDLLQDELANEPPDGVYCCGPEPMMHATARLCEAAGVRCWLSLETPMACGFGACFSCVTRVRVDEEPGWDYRRTCVEGPVFDAATLRITT